MQHLTNLSTIIDNYDALLLDLWGVVHDGTHLYPGVHETLEKLHKQKKKIIFISNAPRRANKAAAVLSQLGVEKKLYDQVITSGELGYQALRGDVGIWGCGDAGKKRKSPHLHISTSSHPFYYYIGPSKDADVLDGLDYQRVSDIKEADFLLNVGFGSEEESAEDWTNLLRAAKAAGLPMVCLNPDFEVVKISGERFACAGVLAADYEKLGGEVKYFGKPFPEVYEQCMELLNIPSPRGGGLGRGHYKESSLHSCPPPNLPPPGGGADRILAIGDGIATDIAGAVQANIDAMLITGGIIKKESPEQVAALCKKLNAVPKYVMPHLAW